LKYFNTLPNTILKDSSGNFYQLKNLMVRAKLMTQLSSNPLLYYQYSLQEGDTPETVAFKYYGDQYRYWLVLIANEIMDPQWQWPLSTVNFQRFLNDKYSTEATNLNITALQYTQSTVHSYQKVTTTKDSNTGTLAIKTVDIDVDTYNSILPSSQTVSFPDGSSVKYSIDKSETTIYDYELQKNEANREIKLINSAYANNMEKQLIKLMSA
jgi:hypothetical protein